MTQILYRFLSFFFQPLGLVCALIALGLIASLRGRARWAVGCSAAALGLLYLASIPAVCHLLLRGLEGRYSQAEAYSGEVIVLLGGAGVPVMAPRLYPETNQYADRILFAGRLFKQGRAKWLVVTGGATHRYRGYSGSEAAINARLLAELFGVDTASILMADASLNTRQDGQGVAALLGARGLPRKIVLVTSAAHMPRAAGVFRRLGFEVQAAPADFHVEAVYAFHPGDLLPQVPCLVNTSLALHEYIGYAVYAMLGWI